MRELILLTFFIMVLDNDVDDDSSLLSFDTETRMKLANLGTALSTSTYGLKLEIIIELIIISTGNKGGYKGLGFASEFGSQEVADSYDCNAGNICSVN